MFQVLAFIGSGIFYLIKKFFPFLIKKFGAIAVKFGIQKVISLIVIGLNIAFFTAVLLFISETYTQLKGVFAIINNASSSISGGEASAAFSCFLNLMHVSGIAAGFNSAFSFGISVLVFFFLRSAYKIAVSSAKIVSDELSKTLKTL